VTISGREIQTPSMTNLVRSPSLMSRDRAAKFCPSKSMPVSTSFAVAGQINLNGSIHASEYALVKSKKEAPTGGNRGFFGSFGGNSDWGKTPITREMLARAT
jgi:hypothetical protein